MFSWVLVKVKHLFTVLALQQWPLDHSDHKSVLPRVGKQSGFNIWILPYFFLPDEMQQGFTYKEHLKRKSGVCGGQRDYTIMV